MTYGEAMIYAREHIDTREDLASMKLPPHSPRMKKDDAKRYYNQKLFSLWVERLCKQIPPSKQEKALKYLQKLTREK